MSSTQDASAGVPRAGWLARLKEFLARQAVELAEQPRDDRSFCCHPKEENLVKRKQERDTSRSYYE